MKIGRFALAGIALLRVSACGATDDPEPGFWQREWLATKRIVTSPVTILSSASSLFFCNDVSKTQATYLCLPMALWGAGETCEEVVVGAVELLSGQRFESHSYPMERWHAVGEASDVRKLVADEKRAGGEISGVDRRETDEQRRIREMCQAERWDQAAVLCRQRFAASAASFDQVLYGTQLAMLNWNCGDWLGAIIAVDAVIAACARAGGKAEQTAIDFRNVLRERKLSEKFTVEEAVGFVGIRRKIVEEISR